MFILSRFKNKNNASLIFRHCQSLLKILEFEINFLQPIKKIINESIYTSVVLSFKFDQSLKTTQLFLNLNIKVKNSTDLLAIQVF